MADDMDLFYKLLKYMGLMAVRYDINNECYRINNCVSYYLCHVVIQAILVTSIVVFYRYRNGSSFPEHDATGVYYNYMVSQTTFGSHIVLNSWLIFKQHAHLRLLESCRRWRLEYLSLQPQMFPLHFKSRLAALIVALILILINLTSSLCRPGDTVTALAYLPLLSYTYCCVILAIVASIYIGISVTLSNILKFVALSCKEHLLLDKTGSNLKGLQDLLNFHDEILYIASEEINIVYGIAILLCTIDATLESISHIYIMAVLKIESRFFKSANFLFVVQSMLWMLPITSLLVVGFLSNNMADEANKTARILAKFSRNNTSVNKMIDKFLLKNLRQKPILTAYGFFSLDKSTLFKLFTAVFTYMVILVQFKEMESSTEKLNNGS